MSQKTEFEELTQQMQQERDLNAWKAMFHKIKRKLVRNMVDAENTLHTAMEKEEWAKEAVDEATLQLSGVRRAMDAEMRQEVERRIL